MFLSSLLQRVSQFIAPKGFYKLGSYVRFIKVIKMKSTTEINCLMDAVKHYQKTGKHKQVSIQIQPCEQNTVRL